MTGRRLEASLDGSELALSHVEC
ncbi:hypothetical protein FRACA_3460004 [Frankia canadensis]|uniref:Uncharacterized protein n=1 Tax=Frankia canadensis TaxID=1836972 RepID=A0A2I2KV78_9ACTN|nr:hypothetical protein FRACA_3460004 [Frankia canadensis]SOU56854.1 hypothetical protein FRACA_3460004 [Frankia canadensis]